jgi:hypothetical protein
MREPAFQLTLGLGIAFFRDAVANILLGQYGPKDFDRAKFIPARDHSAQRGGGPHPPGSLWNISTVTLNTGNQKDKAAHGGKALSFFALFSVYECLRARYYMFFIEKRYIYHIEIQDRSAPHPAKLCGFLGQFYHFSYGIGKILLIIPTTLAKKLPGNFSRFDENFRRGKTSAV